jgi:hypothetical protein
MIPKIIAIATNTFLETIRQPIYGIMLILTCLMMVLNVALAGFTLSDDNLFLRDLGLSTLLVTGLFLASFSASGVITREIDNKTVLTLISKPVTRTTLITGKFVGLATALTTAFYIGTITLLFVVRHRVLMNSTDNWDLPVIIFGFGAILLTMIVGGLGNYLYGWPFSSSAVFLVVAFLTAGYGFVMVIDAEWQIQFPHLGEFQLLASIFLVLLLVWMVTAVALAASCRFGQIPTLLVCMTVMAIGLASDYFFGRAQVEGVGLFDQPTLASQLAWVAYRVTPNFGFFWVTDAQSMGKFIDVPYLVMSFGYALLFIIAFLVLGIAIFQKRELS